MGDLIINWLMWRQLYNSPHFILPTVVHVVSFHAIIQENLFICVYRDINEQDACVSVSMRV